MIDIMKASAGSGKTYQLTKKYIELLHLDKPLVKTTDTDAFDPYGYRHILAVTFTNKATAEMKGRILRELNILATDPDKSNYIKDKAAPIYSMTIAADQRLKKLVQMNALTVLSNILNDYTAFSVSTIDKFFQQTLRAFAGEIGQFASYRVELDEESLLKEAVDRILDGISEEGEGKKNLDWLRQSAMQKLSEGERYTPDKKLYDVAKRLKTSEHDTALEAAGTTDDELYSPEHLSSVEKACRAVEASYAKKVGKKSREEKLDYNTAVSILDNLRELFIASRLRKEFAALMKEKNVLSLSDSASLLRRIIDGSDTPFIYEKMGVRFAHFLLDEFQDTSRVQWDNFRPLLSASNAEGNANLAVGDVKQSIYRWRDSDWDLLNSQIEKEFAGESRVLTMNDNYRSLRNIVEFNNKFFPYAVDELSEICSEIDKEGAPIFRQVYSDVVQNVAVKSSREGRVSFRPCSKKEEEVDKVLEAVRSVVKTAEDGRQLYGHIAILVRRNDVGSLIGARLISEGIPVVSDESLRIKSSLSVRRLISAMLEIDNPGDTIGSYLAKEVWKELPREWQSLEDLGESLLRDLFEFDEASGEKRLSSEILYVQSFFDAIHSWSADNGNNLHAFLQWLEGQNPSISSPEDSNAVHILSIHKSKGLEFPCVIIPFIEEIELFRWGAHWSRPDLEGSALQGKAEGIYDVRLSGKSMDTHFSSSYIIERRQQFVDNINVMYVAMTRAVGSLQLIGWAGGKGANFAKILAGFIKKMYGTEGEWEKGDDSFLSDVSASDLGIRTVKASLRSFPTRGRLKISSEAADFFSEDGKAGAEASVRLRGIVLHGILARVKTPRDLRRSVEDAVFSGDIPEAQSKAYESFLSEALASHKEWFPAEGAVVRNETPLIDVGGEVLRPDRVVESLQSTVVVDYKFGSVERPEYLEQVSRYMKIYSDMGRALVKGYVWYIMSGKVVEVGGGK